MATKKASTSTETKKTATVTKAAEPAKTPAAKTTTEKAAVKTEEKKTTVKVAEEKKAPAKAAAKKTTAKKTTAKKDIKVNAIVEYYGQQMDEKTIVANVKKAWTKSGRKVGEIKTMDLYIKPEESAVYYVINGVDTGAVALF